VTPNVIGNLQVQEGYGVLGLGDKSYGISTALVQQADATTKGFVSTYSMSWRTNVSAQISETTQEPKSTLRSCYQDIGFCTRTLAGKHDKYKLIVEHLIKFVQLHRKRHLVSGRNAGPSATIQHQLLLVIEKNFALIKTDKSPLSLMC